MKRSSLLAALTMTVLAIFLVGGRPIDDPTKRHEDAMSIVRNLVATDAKDPMQKDLLTSRDKQADPKLREESAARTKANCDDFAKLRSLIDPGRPLADYSPIEKLGKFHGRNPNRFFHCGLIGFIDGQGDEPYSIKIDLDSENVITKVGQLVASN